jgi:drug/metabolite transporter (DMT)-like permease
MIFACCIFSLKLIPADMFDLMIVRYSIQSAVFGIYAVHYKHYNVFNTNGQPLACALNIFMSCGTSLTYLAALYFLPLSDINTIKYAYIVWAALLSVVLFKDHFKIINGIALLLTMIGLILATKPQLFVKTISHIFDSSSAILSNTTTTNITATIAIAATTSPYYYLGIGLAFLSSLTSAIQMIARKQLLTTKLPHSVMNFQFTGAALLMSLIYSIVRRYWQPGPYPWKWMGTAGVIIGCCQLITNTFQAKGLKRENVQLISVLGSLDIVYAVILQYVFFRQTKSWVFYIGASLVVSSVITLSIDRQLTNKRKRKSQSNNDKDGEINNNI